MMDPFDSFRRPFPVVEDEDPFAQMKLAEEIQRAAQQSAQASVPAPMREPYEEEDPAIAQQKKEQLLKRIAAAHMQDKMNLAGTQATLRATQRMPSPVHGNFGSEQPPIDRSLVADAMRQKQMEDSMTLNPGMSRFLKGAPAPADPPRPTLGDSLAQQRQGAYKEGMMESGTQVIHMPDGSIALKGNYERGDDGEPGIQLANMSPDDQAEQEFDRKVQADVMRQRLAERNKRENIRKGTFQQAQRDKMNGGFGGTGAAGADQQQMAIEMVRQGGPAFIPLAAEMMKARTTKDIAEIQAKAASDLKQADWQHQSQDKQLDREHEQGMQKGRLASEDARTNKTLAAEGERFNLKTELEKNMAAEQNKVEYAKIEMQKAMELAKITADTDPRRQAIDIVLKSNGNIGMEEAQSMVAGKVPDPSTKPLAPPESVPAVSGDFLKRTVDLGPEAWDTPEEQEALRQKARASGLTTEDLRASQEELAAPGFWNRTKAALTLGLGGSPYAFRRRNMSPEEQQRSALLEALVGAGQGDWERLQ